MTIQIRVDNDALSIMEPRVIVGGSKNYYSLEAVFTSDWNGLNRYVIFPGQNCSVNVNDDGTAVLPEGLISESGILTFGIIGTDGKDNLRIATNYVRLRILEGAREIHAEPPSPDEAATWEGYLGEIAQKRIEEIKNTSPDGALMLKGEVNTAEEVRALFSSNYSRGDAYLVKNSEGIYASQESGAFYGFRTLHRGDILLFLIDRNTEEGIVVCEYVNYVVLSSRTPDAVKYINNASSSASGEIPVFVYATDNDSAITGSGISTADIISRISALETENAALRAQLNGITFDTDTNGNLTYEKEAETE